MKTPGGSRYPRSIFIICVVVLFTFVALPLLSSARSFGTAVTIVNDSSREIRNVYLSPVDSDDWSDNQLSGSISAGQSSTLNNLACSGDQVKVIGEDADGCFVTSTVSCGSAATWTVTNDTPRDCGGSF